MIKWWFFRGKEENKSRTSNNCRRINTCIGDNGRIGLTFELSSSMGAHSLCWQFATWYCPCESLFIRFQMRNPLIRTQMRHSSNQLFPDCPIVRAAMSPRCRKEMPQPKPFQFCVKFLFNTTTFFLKNKWITKNIAATLCFSKTLETT